MAGEIHMKYCISSVLITCYFRQCQMIEINYSLISKSILQLYALFVKDMLFASPFKTLPQRKHFYLLVLFLLISYVLILTRRLCQDIKV